MIEHAASESAPDVAASTETRGPVDLEYVERRTLLLRISELEQLLARERRDASMARMHTEDMRQRWRESSQAHASTLAGGAIISLHTLDAFISHMMLASGALAGRSKLARVKLAEDMEHCFRLKCEVTARSAVVP